MAEEILNLLTKIPGLKVIARTSSFAFRGKEQDITKIAEALRVGTILEGSVRRAGNRLRVTAQLANATDGAHLWSERYDRDMTDVFAIQDDIGRAISEALKVRLAPLRAGGEYRSLPELLEADSITACPSPRRAWPKPKSASSRPSPSIRITHRLTPDWRSTTTRLPRSA